MSIDHPVCDTDIITVTTLLDLIYGSHWKLRLYCETKARSLSDFRFDDNCSENEYSWVIKVPIVIQCYTITDKYIECKNISDNNICFHDIKTQLFIYLFISKR